MYVGTGGNSVYDSLEIGPWPSVETTLRMWRRGPAPAPAAARRVARGRAPTGHPFRPSPVLRARLGVCRRPSSAPLVLLGAVGVALVAVLAFSSARQPASEPEARPEPSSAAVAPLGVPPAARLAPSGPAVVVPGPVAPTTALFCNATLDFGGAAPTAPPAASAPQPGREPTRERPATRRGREARPALARAPLDENPYQ